MHWLIDVTSPLILTKRMWWLYYRHFREATSIHGTFLPNVVSAFIAHHGIMRYHGVMRWKPTIAVVQHEQRMELLLIDRSIIYCWSNSDVCRFTIITWVNSYCNITNCPSTEQEWSYVTQSPRIKTKKHFDDHFRVHREHNHNTAFLRVK